MPVPGVVAAAANYVPYGNAVVGAVNIVGKLKSVVSVIDPGKARDAARISRRDFFLNAAKAGSVTAARYLLAGESNVYTTKEKGEYRDGIKELENGNATYKQTLASARAAGPKWDDDVGAGNMQPIGTVIAQELGESLAVPTDTLDVNTKGAIQSWATQFGYSIRADVAQSVATAAAGVGASLANGIAPPGASKSVLVPTNQRTLIIGAIVVLVLLYFAMRKR